MFRARLVFAILVALMAGGAGAQETIQTGVHAPVSGPPMPVIDQPLTLPEDMGPDPEAPVRVGPCGSVAPAVDGPAGQPDTKPHGQVWAGVGTQGYRNVGGVVCQPIGQDGSLNIAVDAGRWGGNSRH
jgi:hypothetical protein